MNGCHFFPGPTLPPAFIRSCLPYLNVRHSSELFGGDVSPHPSYRTRKCAGLTFCNLQSFIVRSHTASFWLSLATPCNMSHFQFATMQKGRGGAHYISLVRLEHLTGTAKITGLSWILPTGNRHRRLAFSSVYYSGPRLQPPHPLGG